MDEQKKTEQAMELPSTEKSEGKEVQPAVQNRFDSDERFSEHVSDDDDVMNLTVNSHAGNLSFSLPRRQFTKLEVVQAREIENILRVHHAIIAAGIIYTIVVIILMNTVYAYNWYPAGDVTWTFSLRDYRTPRGLLWFNEIAILVMFLYAVALWLIFTNRIFTTKLHSRTKEQYWVICLLFAVVLYLNPYQAIVKIHDSLIFETEPWRHWDNRTWNENLLVISTVLKTSGFTGATLFYIWASIHSYRVLEAKITYMFYLPKLLVLALYVIAKIVVIFELKIYPAELMFASLIGMLNVYSIAGQWQTSGLVYGILSFLFECALGIYICLDYKKTKKVLKNADYLQYRTKQIGFRFFVYHNMTFFGVFMVLYIILLAALPAGINVFLYILPRARLSYFEVHDMMFGIHLMLLAYCTVEAYVNLPADAIGLKGWFRPQLPRGFGAQKSELQPITYRKREPPSFNGVVSDLRVNCFVMQTHVTLFNFAWLVYYWNTPKVENFKLTQDVFKFTIAEYIKDQATDTHVLVVDGEDRIVIVFKGTTSTKNLKTDINMFYSPARALLPTQLGDGIDADGDRESKDHPLLVTREWRRARIHKGFAVAYKEVGAQLLAIVKQLQDDKRRPVFLTGHSLGGALATICSLDLFLRLGLTRKEIFVSTFGAPRVGNRAFWTLYNENVPCHWRIVVGPDVVAKLPKMGYKHVGKKVLLTVDGDLFIDPNSLELNMWSGDVASILYHRKASYMLAMSAWCERHHGDEYLPEFWPFPVSKDDTKRFQHAMVRSTVSGMMGQARQHTNKRARITRLDAMIDALGDSSAIDERISGKWGRLAQGLIEREAKMQMV